MLELSNAFRTNVLFLDDFAGRSKIAWVPRAKGSRSSCGRLEAGRVTVAGKALGIARACFGDAVCCARDRTLRDQPIGRVQMIQSDIAEMATAIEASRALVYKAA
jgi:alkylation response protein AidB-like acyl-CoA dehydrogenase